MPSYKDDDKTDYSRSLGFPTMVDAADATRLKGYEAGVIAERARIVAKARAEVVTHRKHNKGACSGCRALARFADDLESEANR